jgi:endonuclease/exonuclease/phosphatase family metal-dependent hydrolase
MASFSVLSWNIQGKVNLTGFTRYKKITPHIREADADIVALQEIHNAKVRLARNSILKEYHAFIPAKNKRLHNRTDGYNSNVILSKYPIRSAGELSFTHIPAKVHLENCSWAKVKIGKILLKVYSAHFPIYRAGAATRLHMLEHILEDAGTHTGPVIICGDLNTSSPRPGLKRAIIHSWHQPPRSELLVQGKKIKVDERDLFYRMAQNYHFTEALNLRTPTWSPIKSRSLELFRLKLDWFMVKGLSIESYELGEYISDHKSITVRCHLTPEQKQHKL